MKASTVGIPLLCLAARLALGQPAEASSKFEFADVRASAQTSNLYPAMRTGPVRAGRYQVKTATILELIVLAYGYTADKVLGGPNWLDLDRYDVVAKVPAGATPETLKVMLQALLDERFKLAVHNDTRPMPSWVLLAGKKPQLKEAAGTEEPACKVDSPEGRIEGGATIRIGAQVAAGMGVPATLNLGPGGTIQFNCRNMSMESFAQNLPGLPGARASLGSNAAIDQTGLKGKWNFDLRWSFLSMADSSGHISVMDAVDKQLGLKLEERQVPTPVLVVDRVNRAPVANPPGTAEALPNPPAPAEFDVASVKPSETGGRGGRFQLLPGGRLSAQNMTLRFLVGRAFNFGSDEQLAGLPTFADTERFDVEAQSAALAVEDPRDQYLIEPLMRALLADRFKMTWHTEDRPVDVYALVQAKPKMKKADPDSRISCTYPNPPPGSAFGTTVLACRNTTMAQLAGRVQFRSPELNRWPVVDASQLEGGWDFTLTWSVNLNFGGRGGGDSQQPAASDPSGALTIFEAMEKQLGLKLEKQKRTLPVIVIDHIEPKPTEN